MTLESSCTRARLTRPSRSRHNILRATLHTSLAPHAMPTDQASVERVHHQMRPLVGVGVALRSSNTSATTAF